MSACFGFGFGKNRIAPVNPGLRQDIRPKAARSDVMVSASLGTTGTQRCTQDPTSVPLVALSTNVGDPSPPASHPERPYPARHANHHMTDPEASNPSRADAPDTYRGQTRKEFLGKVMAGGASGACGGTIVGGPPGAGPGAAFGGLLAAVGYVVERRWDSDRMTPSLGECVFNGIRFNV